MPSKPPKPINFILYDIRDNILLAQQRAAICRGIYLRAVQGFAASFLRRDARNRNRLRSKQAFARHVRDRHPGLPWRAIRDVGNFYRHQYDNVAESYMWATLHNDLPPLLAVVVAEIEALDVKP